MVLEQTRFTARDTQQRSLPIVLLDLVEDSLPVDAIDRISAVVANGNDEDNTAMTMLMREQGFAGPILAFAETPLHRLPMQHVGVTAVFTPKHLLAENLAGQTFKQAELWQHGVNVIGMWSDGQFIDLLQAFPKDACQQ